jgi:hypothetical protein
MAGYPIVLTEKWDVFDPSAAGSPYTAAEIKAYLMECRSQYSPQEEPFAFQSIDFVATRSLTKRRFWLWEVVLDEQSAQWFVVVGSGTSPLFRNRQNVDRWLYAETNDDGLSADKFLDREIAKHPD